MIVVEGGAVLVLDERTRRLFPFLEKIFADSAYGGSKLRRAMAGAAWETRSSSDQQTKWASRSCPSVRSWDAPSPGSTAVGASPRTTKTSTAPPSPSTVSPVSGFGCEG